MKVLSFGEQALSSAQSIKTLRQVVDQAGGKDSPMVLVISSLRGMRDALVDTARQAAGAAPRGEVTGGARGGYSQYSSSDRDRKTGLSALPLRSSCTRIAM